VSRLFNIRNSGAKTEFPDIGYASYIIETMMGIGYPSSTDGYVKHSEIKAYCDQTGTELKPVEYRFIFGAFIEYTNAKYNYEQNPMEPAPFTTRTIEQITFDKHAAIRAAFMSMTG